jgi:hypothetical protein
MTSPARDSVAVLAPFDDAAAIELGNHYWRKQVLRHGDFAYGDRTLRFTPEYTQGLAKAWREKAYDAVPFQFAGPDNQHTNAIDATRGEIVGFESTTDGLDAIMTLEPEAETVIRRHPRLPVSVRIIENLDRADGQHFDAAVQHVLATWDPRVTAMKPWERVELANDDVDHVLDLTDLTVARPGATTHEGTDMPKLADSFSDEEIAQLRTLLTDVAGKDTKDTSVQDATPAAPATKDSKAPDTQDTQDAEYVVPSDAELERIACALFPEETADDAGKAKVDATADNPQAVELANRLSLIEAENARLRGAADIAAYEKLRDDLARDSGIPPAITDLAKPLLTGAHMIELSGGTKVNAGEVIHKVLVAIGEQVRMLDLSGPAVFDQSATDAAAAADKERESFAKQYAQQFGMR